MFHCFRRTFVFGLIADNFSNSDNTNGAFSVALWMIPKKRKMEVNNNEIVSCNFPYVKIGICLWSKWLLPSGML